MWFPQTVCSLFYWRCVQVQELAETNRNLSLISSVREHRETESGGRQKGEGKESGRTPRERFDAD